MSENILRDLRYGLRGIRRAPGFSAIVVLTLALGLGANTAIFSVVRAVLLKPLPYPASERLVYLGESSGEVTGISVTWINYLHWRGENHSFEGMAGFERAHFTLTGRGDPLFTRAVLVGNSFFQLLGRKPILGRLFTEADHRSGAPATVVLNHKFWMDKLGGDPAILQATLALDGKPYEVIGVASPAWEFLGESDYYLPLALFKSDALNRSQHGSMRVLARLKPGVTLAAARADLDSIQQHLAETDPGPENDHRSYAAFLTENMTSRFRSGLLILMTAAGLVLLIACANVASLILAQSTTRSSEIAIRTAIGAGRTRLIRQLLTENLLLAVLGGASGLLLASWCLGILMNIGPKEIPRLAETRLDLPVFLFAAAVSILAGLLVSLTPLFTAGKLDLVSALKDSSRGATGAQSGQSLRSALIVSEIAITLVLAFVSVLLLRSLNVAQSSYPGFRSQHLLALELVLPSPAYKTADAQNFYDRLIADLRGIPAVTSVGAVHCPPSAGDCGDWFYSVLDRPAPSRSEVPVALANMADPAYFRTMGIPLREGRAFRDTDRPGAPLVAIVNETLARRWWPPGSAVRRRIKGGGPYFEGPVYEIAGVAGDVSQMGLDAQPWPEIYLPFAQAPSQARVLMIRTTGDPESLIPAVRRRLSAMDRNLPIESLRAFEQALGATLERRRFSTLLLTAFAALAMILAGVGIFGLLNYWVSVREEEIAIRIALGASRAVILRWTGGHAMRLAVLGVSFGAAAAALASRWVESLVFGVSARSPLLMAVAALTVIAVAILAGTLPAWRATRIDAVEKLHHG